MARAEMVDQQSIAITGLSCRFPGEGNTLESFWQSICSGKSAWSKVPRERFNVDAFWSPSKNRNTSITQGAHFLRQDISKFDASFFNLPKSEVEAMDPQHRVMIEVAYEALERAGLPLDKISGSSTGVFMGHFTSDYKEMIYRDPENAPSYSITGACKTSLANRISWLWDLRGPSFTVDTACSSSLVALHLACQSLRTGESDIAIVGGTSLLLNPEMFMYLSNQAFLSPDGKCKSFDEAANGYGRGEGFGCVILKRVQDAVSAEDPIRAVIRGTGSNQDGHTKGLTLPSADAQAALIEETYRRAGLDFKTTNFVEAHGTGTQAGDLNETEALAKTIAASHTTKNRLIVGSVKSNIGHLEAAAGIAAIIKSVLILENGVIPPSINFKRGNPKIKFDEWNICIPTELTRWPTSGVRRISVNSFGYGGTNAHAILDDAYHYLEEQGFSTIRQPKLTLPAHAVNGLNDVAANGRLFHDRSGPVLFVWSAQDKEGLKRVQKPLAKYVETKAANFESGSQEAEAFMSDLAYTLNERRSRLQWKTYGIASSPEQLCTVLNDETSATRIGLSSRNPRIGFIFTGQGAQWPRMGAELMAYKTFRESVIAADIYLREECGCAWSAAEELQKGKSTSQLHLAEYSQTLCTVLQVALVDLLRTWSILPTAVAGHSSGEIAAAYAMGALSKKDAWGIAYYRGLLSSEMKVNAPDIDGSMMAAGLSPEKAEKWISKVTEGDLVVACINSPTSVTVSGDTPAIDQLLGVLKEEGVFARKLQVDIAYHSPHMQFIAQDYYDLLANITPLDAPDNCTMHSSVTGTVIEASQLGAINWTKNLTSPVKFSAAIHDMMRPMKGKIRADENAVDLFVEIGPHLALQGPATQTLKSHNIVNIPYHSVLVRNQNAIETAMNLAGALLAQGCRMDIQEVNGNGNDNMRSTRPLVDLPTYPWKHSQRFWHESRVEKQYLWRERPKLGLIGAPSPSVGEREQLWRGFIRLSEEPWIADHKIQGLILYPAAGYVAMALEAASQRADQARRIASYKLRDIQLISAAIVTEEADLECIVQLRPHFTGNRDSSSTWTEFVVTTSPDGRTLEKNCSGLLTIEYEVEEDSGASHEKNLELQSLKNQYLDAKSSCKRCLDPRKFYADLSAIGLEYGSAFANVCDIRNRDGQSMGLVQVADVPSRNLEGCDRPHVIHPGTLDAIFHLAFVAAKGGNDYPSTAMVPKSIDEVTISADVPFKVGTKFPGFSNSTRHGLKDLKADIVMLDDHENLPVIEIVGFLCAEVAGASSSGTTEESAKSIVSKLTWRPAIDLLSTEGLSQALDSHKGLDKLAEYLRLLHHSNPAVSVLEVALESQDFTPAALFLQRGDLDGVARTVNATVACRDEANRSRLLDDPKVKQNFSAKLLDFSQHLPAEEMGNHKYDVVLAPNLSVFASKPELALENMTKVLKNGGILCISLMGDSLDQIIAFFDAKHMEMILIHDSEAAHAQESSLFIVKKTDSHTNGTNGTSGPERVTLILAADPSGSAQTLATELTLSLEKHGYDTALFVWGSDVSKLAGQSCISLLELEKPLLRDLSEKDFDCAKKMILETSSLLWITGFDDPSAAMIDGLARVVRNETPGLSLHTFHAEKSSLSSAGPLAELINTAYFSKTQDEEFRVKDGLLQISRIEEDATLNKQINSLLLGAPQTISSLPLSQAPYPLKLCIQSPGMLDSICMIADDSAETELEPDFIEIQVKATALNFREVMVAMGQIADSKLGLDAAGIVHRVGSAVAKFKVGDKVAMYGHGAHKTLHRSRAAYCALIPEGLSFEQAATIPTIHGTAWNALVRLAKVQKGQSVLIHAAAGGVGQAAIQVAKHFEMKIFATVSSETKRKLIREEYGVLDDHIFNSRDLSFVNGIKRMTNGRGVDVVLNSLSGEALRQTWHCIAPFGYFVEIGLKDILDNTRLDMKPFIQDATFSFFNLTHIENSRPDIMGAIIEGAFDFIRRGITRPVEPLVTLPISDTESGFRLMQTGKHLGKIAFTWGENHVVPIMQQEKSSVKLDSNGVYLFVGGLGGLGRSLSLKLVGLGARKLCFLSRSGAESDSAKDLIRDLEQQKITVQVQKCDVSNEDAVVQAVDICMQVLGTIRGVFQCAMILRDTLFVNMDYQEWVDSTRPKVQGSWNLHKCLPNVDFFITLSSFAAIFGNRGQSNYGAAGAYEDALAYHRRVLGQHATTLDLGIMRGIGVLAETGITDSLREWEEPYGIGEAEFHALMERAIQGDMTATSPPQILTGLATGGSAETAGIDIPFYLDNARFSIMARTGVREGGPVAIGSDSTPAHVLVGQAKSLEEAASSVMDVLMRRVAKLVQTPASEIDTARFLHSYGIDSLVAIEIVNWALKEVRSHITVFDVLAGVPIANLCHKMAAKSAALPKDLVPI